MEDNHFWTNGVSYLSGSAKNKYSNKNTLDNKFIAKMLNDDENIKIPTMPHDLRIAIGQARNQKGFTQ